jgi:hypothetical protein
VCEHSKAAAGRLEKPRKNIIIYYSIYVYFYFSNLALMITQHFLSLLSSLCKMLGDSHRNNINNKEGRVEEKEVEEENRTT